MSTTAAMARTSIVAPGHRKFAASSLTTMTAVVLKPASSGRVALLTESTHILRRAGVGLPVILGPFFRPLTTLSSVRNGYVAHAGLAAPHGSCLLAMPSLRCNGAAFRPFRRRAMGTRGVR